MGQIQPWVTAIRDFGVLWGALGCISDPSEESEVVFLLMRPLDVVFNLPHIGRCAQACTVMGSK